MTRLHFAAVLAAAVALGVAGLGAPRVARADLPATSVGLVAGSGIELGTDGQHGVTLRHTPVFLDASIRMSATERHDVAYGASIRAEVDGRASVAIVPRIELQRPFGDWLLRGGIGAPIFFAPYTLMGIEISGLVRWQLAKPFSFNAGVLLDAFFWGSDLPPHGTIIAVDVVIGFELEV